MSNADRVDAYLKRRNESKISNTNTAKVSNTDRMDAYLANRTIDTNSRVRNNGHIEDTRYKLYGYQTKEAYDSDVAKYTWAEANKGLSYADVKKRKETATGDELNYLNQYGTLVGYNNLDDYDAELNDLSYIDNIGFKNKALSTVYNALDNMGINMAFSDEEKAQLDRLNSDKAYKQELTNKRNLFKDYHSFDKYADIANRPDFEENSKFSGEGLQDLGIMGYTADPNGSIKRALTGAFESAIYGDETNTSFTGDSYYRINTGETKGESTEADYSRKFYAMLTDEEKATFNYIYNTQGKEEAQKFLDDMEKLLSRRANNQMNEELNELADSGFGGSALVTGARILTAPTASLASGANLIEGAISGDYNPYSYAGTLKNVNDYGQQAVSSNIAEATPNANVFGVNVPSFLYDTSLSTVDSTIGGALFGSNYSVIMGMGAFQTSARELADKGASQQDIWVQAGISGLAEIITEHISLDQFEKLIKDTDISTWKKLVQSALRQTLYEGSEEVSSDIINHIADELYNGGASEMSQKIKDYIQMGYSEEDARTKAAQEFAVQVGSSFVGGALSGGTMGAIASGANLAYNSEMGKQLRANNNLDVIDSTANMIDKESDAYKRYANITNGGSIANATNAQIATTYNSIANQLSNEIANAQISDVVAMLKTKGITENVEATGKAIQNFIANGYSTKGISKSDVKILANERVADIVEQIHNGSLEFSLENSKAKVEQYNNLRKAETMRTVFQDATNIERTEDGYRITNEDGTTHVIQNDNITTTESDVMGYVSKYNNEAQSIWLDNYRNSGNIEMFDTAFSEVYALAKDGNALDNNMLAKYGTVLGYKNVADIYTAGTKLARQESQMSAEAIQQVLKDFKAENLKSGEFTYKNVKLDGKTYNIDPNKLSYKKRQVFNYAQGMSALGLNVRVIDDKGKTSLNGQYDRESNSITINLSATFNGKNIKKFSQKYVINTFAHELTHYLEVNAKEAYRPLYNLVKSGLQSRYVSVKGETVSVWDAQIKEEFDVAKNGRNISDEEAMRIAESEVIARACEDVLNDNQQMIDILSQSDSGTLQTIRDAISKFFDKFKAMVAKLMNGFNSNSLEAQAIRDIDGLLDEMRSAWADAFTQAIARTQITEEMEKASGIQTDAETGTVVATQDSRKQTLSLTYERLGYKSYEECVNDVANEINKKANINDVEKVKRWIKAEESIAALIMREQNRQYLDYEADDRYEAIKKNSDYKQGTFDLSNLCRKREIFTKMFDALQRENPDILFDADDIATIRQVLVDSHYEVACALCYVEDRRQNMGEIADAFIGFYKQALESDSKLLFKYVPGKGGEVKKTGLYPTKAQRDKYGLSATQYKANDPYVPKQVDLVTYEGLKNLQKEHPTIAYAFERYNNSRGQQSARVIEGHAEYKREVLNYTDAMVKKANDLGGLRVFSFSDFEAIHLIDVCQIIVDCAKMGVKIQTYTKVPEFAALVRNTGIKLNRSLIPANVGSQNAYARVMENGKQKFVKVKPYANGIAKYKGNDVLAFDNVEGIDVTSKYFLDETDNANIGNILIGMSEDQIKIAMTDPFIDYIIPFHTGQKLSVLHAKGIAEWKNYKDVQLDKKLPGSTSKEKEINIYRVIEKYNPTNKYEFTEAFLKECEEQKFRPRFDEFITKDADGNYQYTEGYYKLLLDFKMFDSNGNILLQENVRPDIDEALAKKILNEGKKREEQIRFDDDIVNKVKEALADKHTLNSAKRSNGTYEKKAIEHFGTTENFNVAGYILNDGQMLDFSGKHWGDTNSKFRQVDHEDIYEVMEKSGDNRKQFMDRGNIRISPEAPGINISTKAEPTAEQYAKIKEFINTIKDGNRFYVDIEDTKPHKVNYNGKISADRVVNDIKSFYETGVMPTGSEGSLSEFLYSSKRDSDGNNLTDAQVEFFKASKARDENGNLMVMYHGTEMGSFDIFEQEGTVANANFFTNSLKVARAYSGSPSIYAPKNFKSVDEFNEFINNKDYRAAYEDGQYNLYLDDEIIESSDSLNDLYRQFWYASGETDSLNYKTYLNATNPYVVDGKGADWDGLTTDINGESMTTNEVVEWARGNGYDSVIFRNITDNGLYMSSADRNTITSTVIAVMNSDQIKSVNNTTPTDNSDIRYSAKRDSEGNTLTKEQAEFFKAINDNIDNANKNILNSAKRNLGKTTYVTDNDAVNYFYKVGKEQKHSRAEAYSRGKRVLIKNRNELIDFINDSTIKADENEKVTFARIDDYMAERINQEFANNGIVGVNVKGYYWQIQQKDLYHMIHGHEFAKEDGDLDMDIVDVVSFFENINSCMVEEVSEKTSKEKRCLLSLMYDDGVMLCAEVVSKKEGTLNLKTGYRISKEKYEDTYKEKSKWSMLRNENSTNSSLPSASNQSVSVSEDNVNTLKSVKRTTEEKLTAENEKLKSDIDNLRKLVRLQGKETNGFIPTKSSIESAAKSILKSAVSTYDRASLEKDLANVWTKLQKGASIESLNDDIRTIADNVVADIKDEVEVDKTYKQMLRNMRATKVRLTENQIAYAKQRYGENYRNAFMGKVILAKNGQSLDTLWEEWTERHPEVFEEGLSEEDMVDGLLEAYATIKEASEYVVELDTELATNSVMQTITEKLWNIASYQTVADKYADQIKQMKAEHRKEMDALKKARDDQRLADDMHYKKLLAQVREQRDERINAIKEFTKMRKETEKQRVERKKTLTKIERISKSLRDKLATDSSKKNVPVNLKVPVLDLLNALDFSSQQLLGMRGGENAFKPTQKDLSIASAMAKLNEQVKASVSAQEDGGFMIDLPGDYADTVAQINTKVTEIQSKVGDSVFVLQQMDNETLNDIADMLVVMNTSVSQMNSLIASRNKHSVDGIAKEIIEESQKKGKRFNFANQGAFARLANGADDFINKKQITPYYFFKHLGSGGVKIFEELQDGFDKYAFHIQDIINYSKENWNGKQVKEWTKDIKKFDIKEMPTQEMIDEGITEGRDVHFEMTVPQIMSLYCLNKREQARKHIEGKGIKIAEFKNGAKMSGDKVVRLTQEQVGEITKVLTDEQIRVADAIQKHMNTVCKNWMNEITMKRFGIIGALEENYFPIKSDSNALSVEANDNNAQGIYRLLNMSFTKQLNINANNEIVVGDIFTVFTDHATDMAKYNTIALPTLDLIKVLNYNETSKTEGSQLQSLRLRNELDTAYGKRAVQYISKMLTDLNGAVRAEQGNELVSTLNRNYKIAAVGANLQVALLQGTSAIRASYVLNPKYIARGYAHRPQVKRVQQECGISAWKQLGFYQINVNRGLEHDIRQDESVYDKITDASMKGAEFMDNLTWGYLYNACEEWARGETQFAVDSEEFRQAVNDKFREVVYSTQVVDSTLTRSDLMRIQDGLAKMATSFMAEPTLTYNMVYDAFNGFISDIRKGSTTGQALRSNGRQIAKAMMAFGVAAILESALRAGIAKLRKPEDEEEYWRKLLDYFLSELNPLSKIPYVKDILEIAQGYGSSNMAYGGIESAYQAFNKIKKIVQKGETPTYKEVYIVVNAASQISGVAGSGAMRDVVMLWNTLCRVMGWESLIIK